MGINLSLVYKSAMILCAEKIHRLRNTISHCQEVVLTLRTCLYRILIDALWPYQLAPQLQTSCRSTKPQQLLQLPWEPEYSEMLLSLLSGSALVASPSPVIMCHLRRQKEMSYKTTWSFTLCTTKISTVLLLLWDKESNQTRTRKTLTLPEHLPIATIIKLCEKLDDNHFSPFLTDKTVPSQYKVLFKGCKRKC